MECARVVDGTLNMRSDTDIKSSRITSIPNGSRVTVLDKGVVWAKISYKSYTGYAMVKYLKFENNNEDDFITLKISKSCANELYEALKMLLEV